MLFRSLGFCLDCVGFNLGNALVGSGLGLDGFDLGICLDDGLVGFGVSVDAKVETVKAKAAPDNGVAKVETNAVKAEAKADVKAAGSK